MIKDVPVFILDELTIIIGPAAREASGVAEQPWKKSINVGSLCFEFDCRTRSECVREIRTLIICVTRTRLVCAENLILFHYGVHFITQR